MKSLLAKILLSSLLVILLPISLAILWTSNTFTTLLERRLEEKSMTRAGQGRLLLTEKQELATKLVGLIAEMPGVKLKLAENDREGLFQLLLPLVGSVEMDFIEILDNEGRVFLRVHNPLRYGDYPTLAKEVRGLLLGIRDLPKYGVEVRGDTTYLRAAESIEGEETLGVVSAGYALDHDFLRRLEQVAGGKVLIVIGERAYSADSGRFPIKTQVVPSLDSGGGPIQWHRDNANPSLEIRFPFQTGRGNEGIVSAFYPAQEMTAAIATAQRTLLMVALMGIVLAFSVSWILSRRMTRPVKELVRATKEVATGNFAGTIGIDSKDEIGTLAASFTRMVDELRKSRTEVENYRLELEKKFTQRGKELAETEKKRAAMAHMIAHDLKNPILGIKKALEGLDRTTPDSAREQRSKILRDLLNAGDLVIGMVNEMLDLYQSDFGDIPLYLTSFQIKECVETSLRILGPELEERGLQVISRSDPPHISLMADKRRLTRLLINLISNAVNFSPDQSHIYVFASLLENDKSGPLSVLLRVEDEGAGIPQEDLLKIFDRFYSRDQGRAQAGTGLGLPYCKLVAESHGGRIWAETRRRGGLTVSLILPSSIAVRQESYGT